MSTEIHRNCNIANLELPLCCYACTVGYPYYPMASWFRLFEPVATETKGEKAMQVECSVCNLLESFQTLSPSLPFSLREVREVT